MEHVIKAFEGTDGFYGAVQNLAKRARRGDDVVIQTMAIDGYADNQELRETLRAAVDREAMVRFVLSKECALPEDVAALTEDVGVPNVILIPSEKDKLLRAPLPAAREDDGLWDSLLITPEAVAFLDVDDKSGFVCDDAYILRNVQAIKEFYLRAVLGPMRNRLPYRVPVEYYTTCRFIELNQDELAKEYPNQKIVVYLEEVIGAFGADGEVLKQCGEEHSRHQGVRYDMTTDAIEN